MTTAAATTATASTAIVRHDSRRPATRGEAYRRLTEDRRVSFCFGVREEACGRRPASRRRWERSCGAARTCVRQSFEWGRGRVGFRRHPRLVRRTSGGKASAGLLVANGYLAARAGGDDGLDPVMNKARVSGFAFCELPSRIRPEPGEDALSAAGGHKHVPASHIHMHLTVCCAHAVERTRLLFAAPRPDQCAGIGM